MCFGDKKKIPKYADPQPHVESEEEGGHRYLPGILFSELHR